MPTLSHLLFISLLSELSQVSGLCIQRPKSTVNRFLYHMFLKTGRMDPHALKQNWYRSHIFQKYSFSEESLSWMPQGREEKECVPLGPLSLLYKGWLLKRFQQRFVGNTDVLVIWTWKVKWDPIWLYKSPWKNPCSSWGAFPQHTADQQCFLFYETFLLPQSWATHTFFLENCFLGFHWSCLPIGGTLEILCVHDLSDSARGKFIVSSHR